MKGTKEWQEEVSTNVYGEVIRGIEQFYSLGDKLQMRKQSEKVGQWYGASRDK